MKKRPLDKQNGNAISKRRKSSSNKRRWDIYNVAKCDQKRLFPILLRELCSSIEEPDQKSGRPRLFLRDMLYCAVLKVFLKSPWRQFKYDMIEAYNKGLISEVPHYNSVSNYVRTKLFNEKIIRLIEISSLPLEVIEIALAIDSTGLSTCRYARWFDERELREKSRREWIKVHLVCGVKTKIVASVITTRWSEADSPYFGRLLETASRNFRIEEISADKGYSSAENMRYALLAGATPFIPFKSNNRLDANYKSSVWTRMLDMYLHRRAEFMTHYNKRNNVETVFHMIKSAYGSNLLSISRQAQFNEALCKVLCHNICVLIQSMYELGIDPSFCSETTYNLRSKLKPLGQALTNKELAKVRTRISATKKRRRMQRRLAAENKKHRLELFGQDFTTLEEQND